MSEYWNIEQDDINSEVNSYTQAVSIMGLLPTPLDAKLCNWFQIGADFKVETIVEYLDRIKLSVEGYRVAGVPVTILLPKVGYEPLLIYTFTEFAAALVNFDIKYYTFTGGLEDEHFIEIPPSHPPVTIAEESADLASIDPVTQVLTVNPAKATVIENHITYLTPVENVIYYDQSNETFYLFYSSTWITVGGETYTLPTASDTVKGGVKIGAGLTMTGEVLSASVGATSYLGLTDTSDATYTAKDIHVPVVNEATGELDLTPTEILEGMTGTVPAGSTLVVVNGSIISYT